MRQGRGPDDSLTTVGVAELRLDLKRYTENTVEHNLWNFESYGRPEIIQFNVELTDFKMSLVTKYIVNTFTLWKVLLQ